MISLSPKNITSHDLGYGCGLETLHESLGHISPFDLDLGNDMHKACMSIKFTFWGIPRVPRSLLEKMHWELNGLRSKPIVLSMPRNHGVADWMPRCGE